MLCIATGLFGLFFFLTLFMQTLLGYSAIRTGIAYLPFPAGVVIASALASPLVARIGPRHRSQRLCSQRLCSQRPCSRTEPPSPRQPVLAGCASRHVTRELRLLAARRPR